MNFFESQAHARGQTKRLIVLFTLAVLTLVVLTNLLVMGVLGFTGLEGKPLTWTYVKSLFDWKAFFIIGGVVIIFIAISSIYKISSLSQGGRVVAQSLGGVLVNHGSDNLQHNVLLNVVEEMAIASGTPVPPVYLLKNEDGINAFAAGFSTNDAVIGITQGALDYFSRDELQGVVAHEFSHIINGDMRINMRLTGILYGITLLGLIGYFIMRGSSVGKRSKKGNQAALLGLGLIVIGYGGTFFGNLIKASVSRKREYLADASAVQFTRNNHGIANALKKIGGYKFGSKLETSEAQSFSHAFFSNAISTKFSSLFSTHPPLSERIKALDPQWTGRYNNTGTTNPSLFNNENDKSAQVSGFVGTQSSSSLVAGVGQLKDAHIKQAEQLISNVPARLYKMAHNTLGAQALIYALLLHENNQAQKAIQLRYLASNLPANIYTQIKSILEDIGRLSIQYRLPLIEIALPQLRLMPINRYEAMLTQMQHLVYVDEQLTVFEWALSNIVANYLQAEFEKADVKRITHRNLQSLYKDIEYTLSVLIHEFAAENDFDSILKAANKEISGSTMLLLPKHQLSIEGFANSVSELSKLPPMAKQKVLSALIVPIAFDKSYTPQEYEVIRAIADCLACPMPIQAQ